MESLLLLFCSCALGLGCFVLVLSGVSWMLSKRKKPKSVRKSRRKRKFHVGCWLFLMILTLNGCAKTTCVPIEVPTCPPMLRDATYRAMQADERRDYRVAVELCHAYRVD